MSSCEWAGKHSLPWDLPVICCIVTCLTLKRLPSHLFVVNVQWSATKWKHEWSCTYVWQSWFSKNISHFIIDNLYLPCPAAMWFHSAATHNITDSPCTSTYMLCTPSTTVTPLSSTTLLCTQLRNTRHSWQNGTRCTESIVVSFSFNSCLVSSTCLLTCFS